MKMPASCTVSTAWQPSYILGHQILEANGLTSMIKYIHDSLED